jgi:hypothetical protein
MKISRDEKIENPTEEQMALDLTVCFHRIEFCEF